MSEDYEYYDSYKEEKDLLLEYHQIDIDNLSVTNILGTGIDNVTRSQAVVKIMKMIETEKVHHVMCLNPYKVMRIKSNNDLNLISKTADMHIACGAGLQWASRMLKNPLKETISILSLMMDLVRVAELKEYSLFLVGAKPEIVEKAFFNIKKSFPKIRIVGRHGGYFNPEREKSVIEAMRKSEANIIFVGLGFPKEDQWVYKIKKEFSKTVFITIGGNIDIISGEIRKAPDYFMKNGTEWFYRIIAKPWRIGRLLRLLLFVLQITFKRIFSRS